MADSSIEWTEMTWNPTTGCHKISAGCRDCYAEIMTRRLKAMGQPKYAAGFSVVKIHETELKTPFGWKKPKTIFVNSMSDLFHKDVPLEFIQKVFETMNNCPQHTFQVLTKRPENAYKYSDQLTWTPNIWMGTSVEDERVKGRIDFLTETDAKVKFLSLEPLIGPLPNLSLAGIDWVIVGGESGHNPRVMHEEWVQDIRLQCEAAGVKFFFKQWGGKNKKAAGRILNGRTYDEMPSRSQPISQRVLSDRELDIIGHSLGIHPYSAKLSRKAKEKKLPYEFYRNRFNASSGHSDYVCLTGLVAKGYMAQDRPDYFHVSDKGILVFRSDFELLMKS